MTQVFEFEHVGRVGKSRGVNGGVKFVGNTEVFAYLLQQGFVFIKMKDGSPVPFQIVGAEEKGDYILYLKNVDKPETAKELTGNDILVEQDKYERELAPRLDKLKRAETPYALLVGLLLKDETSNFQSIIEDIEKYPQQEMLVLESGHLVPLNEEFIQSIDEKAGMIVMELPHGLFDE